VDIGQDQLIGSDGARVITPDRTGVHIFEFVTDDSGSSIAVIDCLRNGRAIEVRTTTAIGQAGDAAGDICADATNLYVCTAAYDSSSAIWKKLVLQAI
jgi:hypothetical protein